MPIYRLRALILRNEAALLDLAGQPTILRLLRERDERRIAERLQVELPRIGFTGAVLLDANLVPIGADRPDLPLAAAERAVKGLDFVEPLKTMLTMHNRRAPMRYRTLGLLGLAWRGSSRCRCRSAMG